MKNLIGKTICLICIQVILACSKDNDQPTDFTNPANLRGTTWESAGFPNTNVEYALLQFLSETRVEGSTKRENQDLEVDWTGVYEIVNDSIFIDYDVEALKGSITNTEIVFTTDEAIKIRFIKQ